MAWAPPMRNTRCTPQIAAAASTDSSSRPSGLGETITMQPTPAARAGKAFISAVDG